MYAIYGNIYHQYTPNVSIYTIHGSDGLYSHETWSRIQPPVPPQLVDAALPLLRAAGPAGDVVGEAVAMHGLVGSTQGSQGARRLKNHRRDGNHQKSEGFPIKNRKDGFTVLDLL